jgi:uncharacterized RDD family membrane protein YckC
LKSVEILTANNITIQYETATVMNRGLALFIDFLALSVYVIVMSIIFQLANQVGSSELIDFISYIFVGLPFIFYSLGMEYFLKGQTLGKLAMGIRTVKLNGENASLNDYSMRWAFKIVDFWLSIGGIGALFITTTENSQRIGDLLAQTTVIKKAPTQKYNIHDILNIKDKSKHQPTYLAVTKFTDEDMILIKNAITRVKKYPNESHKQFIRDLSTKVSEQLNLEIVPEKKLTFLNTVLQDYIVLTR